MAMTARLLVLSALAHGLRPPTSRVAPATRRSALPDLVSLLLAEGPEIEGASAPVGPIVCSKIAAGATMTAPRMPATKPSFALASTNSSYVSLPKNMSVAKSSRLAGTNAPEYHRASSLVGGQDPIVRQNKCHS